MSLDYSKSGVNCFVDDDAAVSDGSMADENSQDFIVPNSEFIYEEADTKKLDVGALDIKSDGVEELDEDVYALVTHKAWQDCALAKKDFYIGLPFIEYMISSCRSFRILLIFSVVYDRSLCTL